MFNKKGIILSTFLLTLLNTGCSNKNVSFEEKDYSITPESAKIQEIVELHRNAFEAVLNNDIEELERLFEYGLDINTLNKFKSSIRDEEEYLYSLSMIAAKFSNMNTFKYLLEKHPYLYNYDSRKYNVLNILVERGDLEKIKFLVNEHHFDIFGSFVYSPLLQASYLNKTEIVKYFIEQGITPNQFGKVYRDPYFSSHTPLELAVKHQNWELIKFLLSKGAEVNLKNHKEGNSPIVTAIINNDLDSVNYLIRIGADVNVKGFYYKEGDSFPLTVAVAEKNVSIVKRILEEPYLVESHIKDAINRIDYSYYNSDKEYQKIIDMLKIRANELGFYGKYKI